MIWKALENCVSGFEGLLELLCFVEADDCLEEILLLWRQNRWGVLGHVA